jgi:pyridoxine 5-phosphate synthase
MGGVYGARTLLCVNLNHVADLREVRPSDGFDPAAYAAICDRAGCAGVSAHLRRDRRYVRDSDVSAIREAVGGRFNLEIGLSEEMVDLAKRVKPDVVTILPEVAGEITGGSGLDVKACLPGIRDVVRSLHDDGIQVSFFIEPDIEMVAYSKECAADRVEICTAGYCNAREDAGIDREIRRICEAAADAAKNRLYVTAGRGLGYMNIELLLDTAGLVEVHIGRSIISRSVEVGLRQALDEMMEILE